DALPLLSLVTTWFADGAVDLGAVAGVVSGVDDVRRLAAPFTPDAVASTCKIAASDIRRLAREFAAADPGALYGRIGLCNQEFGTLASWLVDVVNILAGGVDSPRGVVGSQPGGLTMSSLP